MGFSRCRSPYSIIIVFLLVLLWNQWSEASFQYYQNEINDNNRYYFGYRTDDGQERKEQGVQKSGNVLSVAGSYEYEVDGVVTIVTYVADENGYRPIIQVRRRMNKLPLGFTLDNRIDPKLLGSLAGGGLG